VYVYVFVNYASCMLLGMCGCIMYVHVSLYVYVYAPVCELCMFMCLRKYDNNATVVCETPIVYACHTR